ncbi:MAG: hydantoinase/oxoprolinase family protein [Anaerolineaceae bacterium]|nr:hydantoinase/oxoprolinase family protein [Anaerolineaceae bacterium]
MRDYVLGIDTGGTFTDGVLLDAADRKVIRVTKTLTTHEDLSICVLKALDDLLPEDAEQVKLVSISTTLATNAIVEGKFRPVGLLLMGYDAEMVRNFELDSHFGTRTIHYFDGGHNLDGSEQSAPDLEGIQQTARRLIDDVEAIAVSSYFSPLNASHELEAYDAVKAVSELPVVMGHELSGRLNSIKRATTATLNASLLSISTEFVEVMQNALHKRGIHAPLMVMRSDGALMSAEEADRHPIKTIHSGPAASAIGGQFLAAAKKALVIDIGGTTTDIAVIDGGTVNVEQSGTTVGAYHTSVESARVRSFGLGGDSEIALDSRKQLMIGPQRVLPIAHLAAIEPRVADELANIPASVFQKVSYNKGEYWFLQNEPRRSLQHPRAVQLVAMLREGPMSLEMILKTLGVYHIRQFDGASLIREEIVGRAALTPTDLLHATGEFTPWDAEAAAIAARLIAQPRGWTLEQFAVEVKRQMEEMITAEIVTFLTGGPLSERPVTFTGEVDLGRWFFDENLHQRDAYLGTKFHLKMPIVGMGAPAAIYLPGVAELLGTELILPENYQVANAVGAVSGSVMAREEARLAPIKENSELVGYRIELDHRVETAETLEEAFGTARRLLEEMAIAAAKAQGALEPVVRFSEEAVGIEHFQVRATAIGNPRLG